MDQHEPELYPHEHHERPAVPPQSVRAPHEAASDDSSAYLLPASIIVAALLIAGSIFYNTKVLIEKLGGSPVAVQNTQQGSGSQGTQGQQQAQQPAAPANITLKSDIPYLGNKDAKVTVVEYADYQCPFCERFFTQTMPDIKSKYIDTNKIKFVYQDFAFLGPDSNTAAEGSHCAADQNKFWQYHDYLFSHQGQENSGWATADKIKAMAPAIGLNSSQFNQCLDSGKYKQEVLDETSAGKNYGVTGTPTVFVNGTPLVGAQPTTAFEQAIDAALAKN